MFFDCQIPKKKTDLQSKKPEKGGRVINFDRISNSSNQEEAMPMDTEIHFAMQKFENSEKTKAFWSQPKATNQSCLFTDSNMTQIKEFWSQGKEAPENKNTIIEEKKESYYIGQFGVPDDKKLSTINSEWEKPVIMAKSDPSHYEYPIIEATQLELLFERHITSDNRVKVTPIHSEYSVHKECFNLVNPTFTNMNEEQIEVRGYSIEGKFQNQSQRIPVDVHENESISQHKTADTIEGPIDRSALKAFQSRGVDLVLIVIDCRYYYEYKGSHIKSAINISSPVAITYLFTELKHYLFREEFLKCLLQLEGTEVTLEVLKNLAYSFTVHEEQQVTEQSLRQKSQKGNMPISLGKEVVPLFVVHCEFSSKRGPKFFRQIRALDRGQNLYPKLSFAQLYVLKGGFEKFYNQCPCHCSGEDAYRPMILPQFQEDLHSYEKQVANEWRQLQLTKNILLGRF